MPNAIEADSLCKSFTLRIRGKTQTVQAVRNVSLTVQPGEIFGFLGPNGAGKTTCQRMLTTLLPMDSGRARVAGFDIRTQQRAARRHIGYVSQRGGADSGRQRSRKPDDGRAPVRSVAHGRAAPHG